MTMNEMYQKEVELCRERIAYHEAKIKKINEVLEKLKIKINEG